MDPYIVIVNFSHFTEEEKKSGKTNTAGFSINNASAEKIFKFVKCLQFYDA